MQRKRDAKVLLRGAECLAFTGSEGYVSYSKSDICGARGDG